MPIVLSNWLSWARRAAIFVSTKSVTSSTWFGFVGLPQQERRRAMRHEILIGEEVGIAGGDDGVGDDEPAARWSGWRR